MCLQWNNNKSAGEKCEYKYSKRIEVNENKTHTHSTHCVRVDSRLVNLGQTL